MCNPAIIYASRVPSSVGHIYRVSNHAERFRELGFKVIIHPWHECNPPDPLYYSVQLVILFRPCMDRVYMSFEDYASRMSIPLLADIDDLTFDPSLLYNGHIHFWGHLANKAKLEWIDYSVSQRKALLNSDGVIVSTEPLADAVRALGCVAWVWSNGFGTEIWAQAAKIRRKRYLSRFSNRVVVGYASGTPTHAGDFKVVELALAEILSRYSHVSLLLLGHLSLSDYKQLLPFSDRIEIRPLVPYGKLSLELSLFDINIAPLDVSSFFCQAKSELKFFEAAAIGVPSIVSSTKPFASIVKHADNGFLASDSMDWIKSFDFLIANRCIRYCISRAALQTTYRYFSPMAQRNRLRHLLAAGDLIKLDAALSSAK